MLLNLQTLFDSEFVSIHHALARPSSSPISEIRHATADVLLLPITGLFAKHDGPRRHFIANPNHALFFAYGKPYRISFPGNLGDESLVFQFSRCALSHLLTETIGVAELRPAFLDSQCLLPPRAVLDRNLLLILLARKAANPLAIEEMAASLLVESARSAACDGGKQAHGHDTVSRSRKRRQIELVKELISLDPSKEWTLDTLARAANSSAYHLTRIFRTEVGVPIHRYLIRTRCSKAMEALRSGDADLTRIALDAGFASHSHFTSCFRSLFGTTPSLLRRQVCGD